MTTPSVSFEFFPPRSVQASFRLWDCLGALSAFDPDFVSVTYGAGGTTRRLTHEAVEAISSETGHSVAAHLTCVDASREETLSIAKGYADAGVDRIVALRGDPPGGADRFETAPDGFADSCELVSALAATGRFEIMVGSYPESHPDAASAKQNVEWLKRKIDAGATSAITQFFFEPETFLRFRDACADAGITAPIVPGILPVANWAGTQRLASRCGTTIPPLLRDAFEKAERDGRGALLATAQATELCSDLIDEGVEQLHFYTLNRPELTRDICTALGLARPVQLSNVA